MQHSVRSAGCQSGCNISKASPGVSGTLIRKTHSRQGRRLVPVRASSGFLPWLKSIGLVDTAFAAAFIAPSPPIITAPRLSWVSFTLCTTVRDLLSPTLSILKYHLHAAASGVGAPTDWTRPCMAHPVDISRGRKPRQLPTDHPHRSSERKGRCYLRMGKRLQRRRRLEVQPSVC